MALTAALASAPAPAGQQSVSPPSQMTGAAVVTLQDAIGRARERSPLIDAARQRERAAGSARGLVTRLPNPLVELRGENFGPVSTTRLPRDVFATVSQPIELGGKRGARQATVAATSDLAAAEVSGAEWSVTFTVAETYIDALRARDVMVTLVDQRQSVGDIVALLTQRVREGVSAEADLHKFETEYTRLTSSIARVSVALESALITLSSMIGEPLRPERLAAPVLAPQPPRPTALTETDIASRADVRTAAGRLQRAETLAALERARGVPDVTVTAGYKRTSGFDTGVASVTFPIGIFDRNRVAIAQASGEVGAARFELQLVKQRALTDAHTRWTAAQQLTAQALRSDAELVAPAAIVRTAARSAFVEGRGDVLQLVDAERVYGEASREALELRLDATLAVIQARLALGETPVP
ncbi:MAG: TolC family protein [Vicinamibacterales bacterium]|nr:TolC family protein [Vicinamibacterales bacterium]